MEQVLFRTLIPKALMYMSAAPRKVFIEFSHKSGHNPMFIGNFLYRGFKQYSLIGRFQNPRIFNGRFIYPRTGFGMQSFYRNTKPAQQVKKIGHVLIFQRTP
ncbi:hypothetical protein D3C87_1816220 [compost metagenome]